MLENTGHTTFTEGFLRIQSDDMMFWKWDAKNAMEIDIENVKGYQRLPLVLHPSMKFDIKLIATIIERVAWFTLRLTLYGKDMTPKNADFVIKTSEATELSIEAI